jgi:peptide deformylase
MGKKFTKKYSGWEARVFQHEYDHLEGKGSIQGLGFRV